MSEVLLYQGASDPDRISAIREAAPDVELLVASSADEVASALPRATAATGALSDEQLAAAPRLRWLQSWAAGPDSQLTAALIASPVVLTCCKGNGAIPLAEHAMMLMLMLNRDMARWWRAQDAKRWDPFTHGELAVRTVGLIGTGHSGIDLARKAKAFHMRVLGLRRSPEPVEPIDRMFARADLHAFLGECDIVVVTAPLTPETKGLLGEAEFRAMKPEAHYICFSRGGIADDAALLRALHEGWIAGAGLDAHSEEPLPPGSPFWNAPNTIVTPHNGATTAATRQRGFDIFIANLLRFAAGEPLMNVVDKTLGY